MGPHSFLMKIKTDTAAKLEDNLAVSDEAKHNLSLQSKQSHFVISTLSENICFHKSAHL